MQRDSLRREIHLVAREPVNHALLVFTIFALAVLPIVDLLVG